MRRALAIWGTFPPYGGAGAVRAVKLLKYLPRHGWQIDVIAPRGRAGWFVDEDLVAELNGVTVHRVGRPGSALAERMRAALKDPRRVAAPWRLLSVAGRAARRVRDLLAIPDEYLMWSVLATRLARRLLETQHYDLVWTSSFPYSSHLAGTYVRRRGGPRWWDGEHGFWGVDLSTRHPPPHQICWPGDGCVPSTD